MESDRVDVLLRDVLESDLPILFEHQRDPIASRMAAFTPRDESAFMEHWRKSILKDPAVTRKAIVLDGHVVGNIVSWERSGRRQIGYWIAREHWGKGIATEAVSQLLRCVTERPLYAFVAKDNAASIRVLEKCGFEILGESREAPDTRGPAVEELMLRLGASESRDLR